MKKVFSTYYGWGMFKVPIKMWLDEIDEEALQQLIHLANLPFVFHHVSEMADGHGGYGMPIGGVLATNNAIIPNAVGVDIGCGMCAVKTNIKLAPSSRTKTYLDKNNLKEIMGKVREIIPVGFDHHKEKQDDSKLPKIYKNEDYFIINREYESALHQLGTLGGGNHFIEFQTDNEDNLWIMIHSGSRNLGYKVAKYYNELAVDLNSMWYSSVPKEWELAFLPIGSREARCYISEMNYCINFAFENRKLMMDRILQVILEQGFFEKEFTDSRKKGKNCAFFNIAHNYARIEHHFGKDVWIHRKGATSARQGEIGIIPGSQGTKSYIVEGLGNPESFMSCSHGAGRKMSRAKAKQALDLEFEIKKMDTLGIIHGIRTKEDLDEASGAYKDIDIVMENQKDLVKIVTELHPIGVIKG